uniref:Uncharacterized protein n=1 Tax=Salix viminalis TaxID=40686 RepID=A0A6N2MIC2_SALVM
MILQAAEKATTLHIVDFGVLYGFQWPILIQQLSLLPNGPPKLRLTGIELPQQGSRPAERIEETGRRLAKYCERFKVPFEYNPIAAQNWERIPIEDLKINRDEVLAVHCQCRLKNLFDETVEVDCPKNAILKLIREMNPDIFVHTIMNGSYNAPFFLTRFREALFHFSSLFDMFDSTLPREDQARIMFEGEFYGRDAMNVVACEGQERVERPETYKQWQVRTARQGFKTLPLDQKLMTKFRGKLKNHYHKDFVIDEDNDWMLQDPTADAALKYISQVLMEEESETRTFIPRDLSLRAAERPFSDILFRKGSSSDGEVSGPNQTINNATTYCCNTYGCSSSMITTNNFVASSSMAMRGSPPVNYTVPFSLKVNSPPLFPQSVFQTFPRPVDSSVNVTLKERQLEVLFRGDETWKFHHQPNEMIVDFANSRSVTPVMAITKESNLYHSVSG